MTKIEDILQQKINPKEKQLILVEAVVSKNISTEDFFKFFETASDVDKGTCADAMKHISFKSPEILLPYIEILINHINYKAPRVKWGIPEAIGNLAKKYPDQIVKAIPYLLKNISDDKINTIVIRWCSAFALTEIALFNTETRTRLIPVFEKLIAEEKNNGVKNLYVKAIKMIRAYDT